MNASQLEPFLHTALEGTGFTNLGEKYTGKVRDVYHQHAERRAILVATDRQSAFDILWCAIPLKGQALTQMSAWWFEQISDIMPTHVIDIPDPNAMVVKELQMLPIEIIVRSYLTGSSKTSVWMNYDAGIREYCGVHLPDGMVKNQKFEHAIVTPTTKGEHDDELISPAEIVKRGLATQEQWQEIEQKALALFARGQQLARERGLILVDTKYEMGIDDDGVLTIADEVHTPDSSRYWVADSYDERFAAGQEPESLDKEFFRLWLRGQGFEYGGKKPEVTDDVRLQLSAKYIDLYERITGESFLLPNDPDVHSRLKKNLEEFTVE